MNDTFLWKTSRKWLVKINSVAFNTHLSSRHRKLFLKFPQMCDAVQHDHSATSLNESSSPMGTLLIDIFLNTDMF